VQRVRAGTRGGPQHAGHIQVGLRRRRAIKRHGLVRRLDVHGLRSNEAAYTATLARPASRQARAILTAISPRLAIKTLRTQPSPGSEHYPGPPSRTLYCLFDGHWNLPAGGHQELPGDGRGDHAV
jgi:hypothetical protein